jgi:hypothetical protein
MSTDTSFALTVVPEPLAMGVIDNDDNTGIKAPIEMNGCGMSRHGRIKVRAMRPEPCNYI